mmetsp:Transcript_66/g.137  ORF Transcript_66/g.137 Transcript_66/m.137 type:complete len:311 (-) Transcript_66:429-1361(-)
MKRRSNLRIRVCCQWLLPDSDDVYRCESECVGDIGGSGRKSLVYRIRVANADDYSVAYPPFIGRVSAFLVAFVAVFMLMINPPLRLVHNGIERPPNATSIVCVPGRGFSGFWFAFGRLQAIGTGNSNTTQTGNDNNDYYCYSSGCLCAAASLANRTFEDVLDAAVEAQNRWKEGKMSRYDIVPAFIDAILEYDDYGGAGDFIYERLNVLLTTRGSGVTANRPRDAMELRELLIQTTWIPFVTGSGLWVRDSTNGRYHMDGAFSSTLHPPCDRRIDSPHTFDVIRNSLNPNLDKDTARRYYEQGMRYDMAV